MNQAFRYNKMLNCVSRNYICTLKIEYWWFVWYNFPINLRKGNRTMDIIHQIASVTKAITDAGNHELYQTLQEISVKAYELQMENIGLKEKIREYEQKERDDSTKEFKNQTYYFSGEGPYCTKCYDDESKKIRMLEEDNNIGSIYYTCPKCKNSVFGRESKDTIFSMVSAIDDFYK